MEINNRVHHKNTNKKTLQIKTSTEITRKCKKIVVFNFEVF